MIEIQTIVVVLISIGAFLTGSFLTAVAFITSWTTKLATLISEVKMIKEKIESWEKDGMPTCSLHQGIETRLREVEIEKGQRD